MMSVIDYSHSHNPENDFARSHLNSLFDSQPRPHHKFQSRSFGNHFSHERGHGGEEAKRHPAYQRNQVQFVSYNPFLVNNSMATNHGVLQSFEGNDKSDFAGRSTARTRYWHEINDSYHVRRNQFDPVHKSHYRFPASTFAVGSTGVGPISRDGKMSGVWDGQHIERSVHPKTMQIDGENHRGSSTCLIDPAVHNQYRNFIHNVGSKHYQSMNRKHREEVQPYNSLQPPILGHHPNRVPYDGVPHVHATLAMGIPKYDAREGLAWRQHNNGQLLGIQKTW